jgi:hypothetical protein
VSTIAEIIRDLLIFVGVMTLLLVGLLVVLAKMPSGNPLKRLLTALAYRVGATLAAGAFAIPLEPIPGLDIAYDVGVPVLLLLYWALFFKKAGRMMARPSARRDVRS